MTFLFKAIPVLFITLLTQAGLRAQSPEQSLEQLVPVIRYPQLKALLARQTDSVLVVNFWATWCGPCVAELPYFEQLAAQHPGQKVRVVLVNLDGVAQLEKRVRPFLARRPRTSAQVVAFDEASNPDWLNLVDPAWSGALPFTILIGPHQRQRKTFEKELSRPELVAELYPFFH